MVDRCSCQMKGRDMLVFGVCGAEIVLTKLLVGCGLIPRMQRSNWPSVVWPGDLQSELGRQTGRRGKKKCYFLRKYSDVWWISHHFWHGTCLNYKMMKDTGGIQLWFYISQMLNSRGTPVRMQAPWQQHNRSQTVGQALLTRWKVQVKHEFKQEGGQNEAWDSPISFNSANQVTRNKGSPINP